MGKEVRGGSMNDNIKPCPFCGCNNISVKLKTDCYSSWARVECQRCMAYAETGTDKPHATCPTPVEDWRECGIRKWNREVSKPKTEVIERAEKAKEEV